jgi:nitrogen fixation protein FixH
MKRGWQWPALVTLALGFTVGVNFVMLYAAKSDPNGTVVEPDYYRKAVEWDRTMARREASAALGWTARASLEASASLRELRVALADSSGVAVTNAEVTATLIHNREASTPLSVALKAHESEYVVELPALRSGLWEVRVVARRGGERFESTLHAESP